MTRKTHITSALKTAVKSRDNYTCRACGFGGSSAYAPFLDCDHIVPESMGGKATLDNLQCLCGACNRAKNLNVFQFEIRQHAEVESVWAANQRVVGAAFTIGVKQNRVTAYLKKLR